MNNSSLPRVGLYSYAPNPATNSLFKSEIKGFLGIFYTFFAICLLIVIRYLVLQTVLKNLLPKQPTKKTILLTVSNLEDIEDGKKEKDSFVNN